MTAVAEQPKDEIETPSGPPPEKVYISHRAELVLVLRRDMPHRNAETGEIVDHTSGEHVQFVDHRLVVPLKGWVRGSKGEQLSATKVIAAIEGDEENGVPPHHLFGDREEGFFLMPQVPPAPTEAEMAAVVDMAMDADTEGLEALIAREEDAWARPEMLELARGTLERLKSRLGD